MNIWEFLLKAIRLPTKNLFILCVFMIALAIIVSFIALKAFDWLEGIPGKIVNLFKDKEFRLEAILTKKEKPNDAKKKRPTDKQ